MPVRSPEPQEPVYFRCRGGGRQGSGGRMAWQGRGPSDPQDGHRPLPPRVHPRAHQGPAPAHRHRPGAPHRRASSSGSALPVADAVRLPCVAGHRLRRDACRTDRPRQLQQRHPSSVQRRRADDVERHRRSRVHRPTAPHASAQDRHPRVHDASARTTRADHHGNRGPSARRDGGPRIAGRPGEASGVPGAVPDHLRAARPRLRGSGRIREARECAFRRHARRRSSIRRGVGSTGVPVRRGGASASGARARSAGADHPRRG